MLAIYKAMNINLLRIWGGGILEKEDFYKACDEVGIMVWREFPLSSSGCSDYPPDDPETVAVLSRIAESMVRRRCHHACHIMWDGGNELAKGFDGRPEGREVPIDVDHPLIAEFEKVVAKWDSGKKFIPTSGHGPRAFGLDKDFGKGVHHDVHGHWAYLGPESHYTYYNDDDALWRSEVGVPGSTSSVLMKKYSGGVNPWPADR
jgi:beta-mannosidase